MHLGRDFLLSTDFMFQMTQEELSEWKSQNVIPNKGVAM